MYRAGSQGLTSMGQNGPGDSDFIGLWAEWVANTVLTQSPTMYDITRAGALNFASHGARIITLNEFTGYIPAWNDGPDRAGGSYPQIGAPLRDESWATNNLHTTVPQTPPGLHKNTAPSYIYPSGGSDSTHWPQVGNQLMYMVTGDRRMLDITYWDGNFAVGTVRTNDPPYGTAGNYRNLVIGGNEYHARVWFLGGLAPRAYAWGFRGVVVGSVLGGDTRPDGIANPEKTLLWDYVKENFDGVYAYTHGYASPQYEAGGYLQGDGGYNEDGGFMAVFVMTVGAWADILTRYTGGIPQAGSAYLREYAGRMMVRLWTTWPSSAPNHQYWNPVELNTNVWPYEESTSGPSDTHYTTDPKKIGVSWAFLVGGGSGVDFAVDAAGNFTYLNTLNIKHWQGDQTPLGRMAVGDIVLPYSTKASAAFPGGGPYYVRSVAWPNRDNSITWTLTTTPPPNSGSGAVVRPVGGAVAGFDLAFAPASTFPPPGDEFDLTGNLNNTYTTHARGGFALMLVARTTNPAAAAAFAGADARLSPVGQTWQGGLKWAFDATVVVP